MINDFDLSEFLVARIFHDISGPVGAVKNGTTFLGEGRSEIRNRALDLIETSAVEAVCKIQFYRKAFGNTQPGTVELDQFKNTVESIFKNTKIIITWDFPESNFSIQNFVSKLICNLVYVTSTVMIYGGSINIKVRQENESYNIEVKGESMAIKYSHDITEIVLNKSEAISISTHNVHLFYIKRLFDEYSAKYKIEHSDNSCIMSVSLG